MTDSAFVYLELDGAPVRVGRAWFTQRRGVLATSFRYDVAYLQHPHAFAIDPSWPLFEGNHHAEGLPGAFRDCSPDRWGQNLIRRQLATAARAEDRTPPLVSDVDFLLGVSDHTREGALRFRAADDGPFLDPSAAVPLLIELPRLLHASDAVARDAGAHDAIKALLDAGSGSLGGARPKASVADGGRLHIAKFPHPSDEWDVMAWEKTALDLAERAGIRTPARRLTVVDGRSVLLLERFDRRDGRRVGYVSAMTMLGAQDGDVLDYAELAEALPEYSSRATADLRELWRRIVVSVAIHNTDDHMRNLGFLRDRSGWSLAPVFDINPNPALGSTRVTSIGGGRSVSDEIDGLVATAPSFRVAPPDSSAIIREVVVAVSLWREVAAANGIARREREQFAPSIEDRLRHLADAASRARPYRSIPGPEPAGRRPSAQYESEQIPPTRS